MAAPSAVVYLLLIFLETLAGGDPYVATVLQDGVPAYTMSLSAEASDDNDIYRIASEPVGDEGEISIIRIEESDLVAHNYLIYLPELSLPAVVGLAPVLSQFAIPSGWTDLEIALQDSGGQADAPPSELSLGTVVYVMRRGELVVMSAPEAGIVVLISSE